MPEIGARLPNGAETTFAYDAMLRPLVTTNSNGGQETLAYNDSTPSITLTSDITSSVESTTVTTMDGLGAQF